MPSTLLLVGACWREAGERSWWRIPRYLILYLILVGKGRYGSLMQINWCDDCAAGRQLARQLYGFSKLVIGVLSDFGVMMTEIVGKQRLVSCLFDRPKYLGCDPAFRGMRIWIGIGLSPLPSINKWILHIEVISVISSEKSYFWIPPLLSLLSLHESLLPLYQVKKGKGERMVAELPLFGSMFGVICQSLWWAHHDTSIIVTGLCRQGR